ncbi:Shikimate kinase [bioreactor metagenome]|uniref:Shikimate kinase n=1 Tax=bioreactor metagenome TaxID=1076179 RepID=A0A644YDL7_9ZZZZ
MKQIVFLGIKHSGKTTQGRLLAAGLQWPFRDSDELLAARYRELYGENWTPREIMKRCGADFFRHLEAEVVATQADAADAVLALGGGVPVNEFLRTEQLKRLGYLIYLQVDPEVAFARIAAGGLPPFLESDDPHRKFIEQYRERSVRYREIADWCFPIAGEGPAETVHEAIMAGLKERGIL